MSQKIISTLRLRGIWRNYSALILSALLILVFNRSLNSFNSFSEIQNILLYNTGLMLAVAGLGFVMIGGGIDFSIGYQISLIAAVISVSGVRGLPTGVVVLLALLTGVACGTLNGVLVAYGKLAPFAATIATQVIFRGFSYLLTGNSMVSSIASIIRNLARREILYIRLDIWIVAAAFLVLWVVIKKTVFGKNLRAVGLNEAIAAHAGVNTPLVKCISYSVSGFFYGLAAMVLISKRGYSGSEIGIGMEVQAIVAAYIGGVLALAEKQNVLSLLFGCLALSVIENGLPKVGVSGYVQYVVMGLILIISILMERKKA